MPQFKRPPIQSPTLPQPPFDQTESSPFQLPWDQQTSAYPQQSPGYPERHTQFQPPPFRPSWNQPLTYPQQPLDYLQQQPMHPEQQSLLYPQQQPVYQPQLQQPTPPLQTKKKSHGKVLWIGVVMIIVLMVGVGALASQAGNSSISSNTNNNRNSNVLGSTSSTPTTNRSSNTTRMTSTPTSNPGYVTSTPTINANHATSTPTSTITSTGSGTWTTTSSYTGSGILQTKTFTVGNDWKILWACEGLSVDGRSTDGVLAVYVHAPGKVLPLAVPVKTTCKAGNAPTTGSAEEHSGGMVYLIIVGTSNWTIQIQELK